MQAVNAPIAQANILWLRGERAEAARVQAEAVKAAAGLEPTSGTRTAVANAAAQLIDEDPARCIGEMIAAGGPMLAEQAGAPAEVDALTT